MGQEDLCAQDDLCLLEVCDLVVNDGGHEELSTLICLIFWVGRGGGGGGGGG